MHIRPFAGAKVQAKCTKSHLYAMLAQSLHWRGVSKRNDGVLETSEAALDAILKMTVSLKLAKRYLSYYVLDYLDLLKQPMFEILMANS